MMSPDIHLNNHPYEENPIADDRPGGNTASGGCCGHTPKTEDLAETSGDNLAACPVMAGTPVIKSEAEEVGLYRDYQGQRYWLCCDGCGPLFDADPDRYAATA